MKSERSISLEWLDLQALTKYAALSINTIREWIHNDVDPLPAVQVGGKLLIRKSEFDTYLDRHRVKPLGSIDMDAVVKRVLEGAEDGS